MQVRPNFLLVTVFVYFVLLKCNNVLMVIPTVLMVCQELKVRIVQLLQVGQDKGRSADADTIPRVLVGIVHVSESVLIIAGQ